MAHSHHARMAENGCCNTDAHAIIAHVLFHQRLLHRAVGGCCSQQVRASRSLVTTQSDGSGTHLCAHQSYMRRLGAEGLAAYLQLVAVVYFV